MRNSIYRSWFKGEKTQGASAIIFVEDRVISCDPTHTFIGRYTVVNGQFHADVLARRHTRLENMASMSELDIFHIVANGHATDETAKIRCSIAELPGISINIEFVWLGEL